jgi:hypothetical protein
MIKKRSKLIKNHRKWLKTAFYYLYISKTTLLTPPKNLLTTIGSGRKG